MAHTLHLEYIQCSNQAHKIQSFTSTLDFEDVLLGSETNHVIGTEMRLQDAKTKKNIINIWGFESSSIIV